MGDVVTYREFDKLVPRRELEDTTRRIVYCPFFESLWEFALSSDNAKRFFVYASQPEVGRYVTPQNYVGTIRLANGIQVEILPKCCETDESSVSQARTLLIDMLNCLRDAPFRVSRTARLAAARMNLSQVFIRMFLEEVQRLVKSGIRADYVPQRGNLNRLRGRLLPSEQLRRNLLYPARLFCAYDEYHRDCPENRLVKATLLMLRQQNGAASLHGDINRLLGYFGDVCASTSYAADFARVRRDRNRREYARLMEWARVFLLGQSFTGYSGDHSALALLFPMERLFEDYVAHHIRRKFSPLGWQVSIQETSCHLFEGGGERSFSLKPDIVLRREGRVVLLDTKWKVLSDDASHHYGVSHTDMYQMCAYAARYNATHIYLLYPFRKSWMTAGTPVHRYAQSPTGAVVTLFPLNLLEEKDMEDSLSALEEELAPYQGR